MKTTTPTLALLHDDNYIQIIEDHINTNLIFIYNNKYDENATIKPDIRILSFDPIPPQPDDLINILQDLLKDKNAPTAELLEDFKESILYNQTVAYWE